MIGIPADLRALLANNVDAMECFLNLSEDLQSNVIIRANKTRKQIEMNNLIGSLSYNNSRRTKY